MRSPTLPAAQGPRAAGRSLRFTLSILMLALTVTASLAFAQGGPVQYGYDELGRLIIVVDGSGNSAIYNYDAVGNLLSVQRIDPNQLGPIAVTAITPTQGRAGSTVSIFGKGFGAAPGQNTVSFTGGTATVTGASPTALRVTVPASAVSGPITDTAAAGSATSAQSFSVIGPLTITPPDPPVPAGGSIQLTATGPGGSLPPVLWTINDGGATSVGTVSAGGVYSAPPSANQPITAIVTATDQRDATAKGSVTVTIVPRRLATAGQGVSVLFAPKTIMNSLQTVVSAIVGGTVNKSLQTSVSAVIRGGPSAVTAAAAVSVTRGPVITGVAPATGARGATGLQVTLIGSGFSDATQVTFLLDNTLDTTITASLAGVNAEGTQATLSVSIASGATAGPRIVRITTPAGTSTVVGTGPNVLTVQ